MSPPIIPNDLLHDQRPIDCVAWGDEPHQCYAMGHRGVTKIEVYGEPSHYCDRPWFRVFVGKELIARRDASGCSVSYRVE